MGARPLVSVIIPTYNRSEIISATIDNVFEQTYRNCEVIVIDDGSTDDTQSRLRQFGDRIRVFSQANAGPAAARNRGIGVSLGDIIAFQDSDDSWEPTKLEEQVTLLERVGKSVPCCLCNAQRVVNGKPYTSIGVALPYEESLWLNVVEMLAARFVLFNQTVAIRREALMRVGSFDESLKYLEDYDLPFRLGFEGPWALIRKPLVIYREGASDSFSQRAHRDPVGIKECEVKIFTRALEKVKNGQDDARVGKYLTWRLKMFRRALRVLELKRMSFWGARAAGSSLGAALHYYEVALGKVPWWVPKMVTVPVDEWMSTRGNVLSGASSTNPHGPDLVRTTVEPQRREPVMRKNSADRD